MSLKANDHYLLSVYEANVNGPGLDYGCGAGRLVAAARERGYEFEGVELPQESVSFEGDTESDPLAAGEKHMHFLTRHVHFLSDDGVIPFPDESFAFVCSNQVLEHVSDLPLVVDELARVTRSGGVGLHVFPTREIVREPHLGVPFFHRIPRRLRRLWCRPWHASRQANFSTEDPDFDHWFTALDSGYDAEVHLRPASTVIAALDKRFQVSAWEHHKLSFHLRRRIPESSLLRAVEYRRVGATVHVQKR